jgi:hypothetical protein
LILKVPDVAEFSLVLVWMNGKSEDTIGIIETLGLVKSKELKRSTRGLVAATADLVFV